MKIEYNIFDLKYPYSNEYHAINQIYKVVKPFFNKYNNLKALSIIGGGTTLLSILDKNIKNLVAVDINPSQIANFLFQIYLIKKANSLEELIRYEEGYLREIPKNVKPIYEIRKNFWSNKKELFNFPLYNNPIQFKITKEFIKENKLVVKNKDIRKIRGKFNFMYLSNMFDHQILDKKIDLNFICKHLEEPFLIVILNIFRSVNKIVINFLKENNFNVFVKKSKVFYIIYATK